jgi:hypothetical protein
VHETVATFTPCQSRGKSSYRSDSVAARQTHPEHRAKVVSQPISNTSPPEGRHSWDADLPCMIRTRMTWPQTGRRGVRILCRISAKLGAGVYVGYLLRHIPEDRNRDSTQDQLQHCVGDVQYLPELWDRFWKRQADRWQDLVSGETKERVAASQRLGYQPHGPDRAMALWVLFLDQWNYVPSPLSDFDESFGLHDDWDNN